MQVNILIKILFKYLNQIENKNDKIENEIKEVHQNLTHLHQSEL